MNIKVFLLFSVSSVFGHASLPNKFNKEVAWAGSEYLRYNALYNVLGYDNLRFGNLRLHIEENFYPLENIHVSYKSGRISITDDGYVSYACETSVVAKKIGKIRLTALNLDTYKESQIEYELDASHVVSNNLADSESPCVPHFLNIEKLPMRLVSSSRSMSNALLLPVIPRHGYDETRLRLDDLRLPFEVFWQLDGSYQLKKALIKTESKKIVGFHLESKSLSEPHPRTLSEDFPDITLYDSSANERLINPLN